MDFNPVALVMQPREIDVAIKSIKDSISIPIYFFRAFTEPEVCRAINEFVDETDYSHYCILADDVVLTKKCVNAVLDLSSVYHKNNEIEVVTGWCNLFLDEDKNLSKKSNVCYSEIAISDKNGPIYSDYNFENTIECLSRDDIFDTYLISFAFSCIPRNLFIEVGGMKVYNSGYSSDHNFSIRYLKHTGKPARSSSDMFMMHLKRHHTSPLRINWLIGKEKSSIIRL